MADRLPLIVDSSAQRIKELPTGDNLNLSSAGVLLTNSTVHWNALQYDPNISTINTGILTTSSTSAGVVTSMSSSSFRSMNAQIQVSEGSTYNMTTINIIHDGTNTYMSEYGSIHSPSGISTFSSDIDSGSLRLLCYPASTNSKTFKVFVTATSV